MKWFKHFLDIIYPRTCETCEEPLLGGENLICSNCIIDLPRTNSHFQKIDKIDSRFWGKTSVINTFAFMKFSKKGKAQRLLHGLKYANKPELGKYLGKIYGAELKAVNFNENIDLIIGVPLHLAKLAQRGYNQADYIAEGLSEALGVPYDASVVRRMIHTDTQTKKSRIERFQNVENIFQVLDEEKIKNKRIAIVDDVLTTGATIESLGNTLLNAEAKEISIITIAAVY